MSSPCAAIGAMPSSVKVFAVPVGFATEASAEK
jgi:hypothetical protein